MLTKIIALFAAVLTATAPISWSPPANSLTNGQTTHTQTVTGSDGNTYVYTIADKTGAVEGCQTYYPAGTVINLAQVGSSCWANAPSKTDQAGRAETFLGWSERQVADVGSDQDSATAGITGQITMPASAKTVYAVWQTTAMRSLSYDINAPGDADRPNAAQKPLPGTPNAVSVPYNTPAQDSSGWTAGDATKIRGYRFDGWYANRIPWNQTSNLGAKYDFGRNLAQNTTVYAHWTRLSNNIVYNANGGTGSHANTSGYQYSNAAIPSGTSGSFKRVGYRFTGWNTRADGKGTAYKDGDRVPIGASNVTLYAQWAALISIMPSAGGDDTGPSVPYLACGALVLAALIAGIVSTLRLKGRSVPGRHSR